MSRRAKYVFPLIVLALILLIGGFTAVPRVLGALPGEYRVRLARIPLMEPLLEAGTTPLPEVLPARRQSWPSNRESSFQPLGHPRRRQLQNQSRHKNRPRLAPHQKASNQP